MILKTINMRLDHIVPSSSQHVLFKGDERTSFQGELADRFLTYQKRKDFFYLSHDIFFIDCPAEYAQGFCTACVRYLGESVLSWNPVMVQPRLNNHQFPAMAGAVNPLALLKAARRMRLIPQVGVKRAVVYLCAACAAVAALGVWHLYDARLETAGHFIDAVRTVWAQNSFRINSLICVLLSSIITAIVFSAIDRKESKNIAGVTEAFQKGSVEVPGQGRKQGAEMFAGLVLNMQMPLAFIIPSFAAIDAFSRKVIEKILCTDDTSMVGNVLWVVCESPSDNGFRDVLAGVQKRRDGEGQPKPGHARAA